jgi:hypothetical protein
MIFTDNITVFNYIKSTQTWERTYIYNVQWSRQSVKTISADGKLVVTDSTSLTLTESTRSNKTYIDPISYQLNPIGHYTFDYVNNKDYVVRGIIDKKISSSYLPTQLKKEHENVGIVASLNDNRNRDFLKNIKVVLK